MLLKYMWPVHPYESYFVHKITVCSRQWKTHIQKGKTMSVVSNSGFFCTNSSSNDRPTPTLVPYPRVCAISPGCISPGVIRNGQKKSRRWLSGKSRIESIWSWTDLCNVFRQDCRSKPWLSTEYTFESWKYVGKIQFWPPLGYRLCVTKTDPYWDLVPLYKIWNDPMHPSVA